MEIMKRIISICFFVSLVMAGCSDIEVDPVQIMRVDQMVANFPEMNSDEQEDELAIMRPELDAMFRVMGWPAPGKSEVEWWAESEAVKMFQPAVDSVFPSLDKQEFQLAHILHRAQLKHFGLPDNLKFGAVVWGKPQPIVRVDSVVLIALNHYLGADFEGYSHWEYYRRAEKTPRNISYDLAASLMATQYPFATKTAPTLLSWMLYEGALVEARMTLVPQASLNIALGYDAKELEYLEDNTKGIWDDMKLMKIIYSTDPNIIDRFIAPSPVSPLVNYKVPGRIGRYIGYKIVLEYLKNNPSTALVDIFKPEFYDNPQTLINSGF